MHISCLVSYTMYGRPVSLGIYLHTARPREDDIVIIAQRAAPAAGREGVKGPFAAVRAALPGGEGRGNNSARSGNVEECTVAASASPVRQIHPRATTGHCATITASSVSIYAVTYIHTVHRTIRWSARLSL